MGDWFPYQDSIIDSETGVVEWIPIDPESKDRVCFKQPDPDEMRIRQDKYRGKKINIPVLNTLSKTMEIVIKYEQTPEQEKAERMDFWDDAILHWEIFDPNGELIPCTAENKYKLIKGHTPFLRFCNRYLQMLSGITAEQAENEIKNS